MERMANQDKRRSVRWGIDRLASLRLKGAEEPISCRIKDISFKGVMIIINHTLPSDNFLDISFCCENLEFQAQVWVVWHKRIGNNNVYGLYFSRMADSSKEDIYKFVLKYFSPLVYNMWYKGANQEGGENMEDRRIFSRFAANLAVKFLDPVHNKEGVAQTSDVSAKGLGLVTTEELSAHTPLEIWLEVPDKGEPLYTRGEVVWSKKISTNKFQAGINLERADLMGMSRVLRTI